MTTQAQVIPKFGEQTKAFSINELKRLIVAAKSMSDLDQAKRYLCSYFIPCADPHGVFWWDPDSILHTQPEQGPSQKTEFNIYKWFMVENTDDIWCSGDWNLTEYIIKWLAGVSAGRKMYSILYLKSGQGWGKGIITDFIQRSVLGTQLVYKTSDPQTIRGSFNGQLQGKILLLLEEMPTEKSQWNNLYRSLKDKVTSDIMEIHEKYKTPTHYKNFMSTIVLTNENALRVDNDDRRTVFLDVSPSRKGDLNYFKKLGDAMKYPGASEAFYAYLRAIANTYSDFNGNPPPMTTSKQEHIISTLPPLFQFIKDTYLIVKNYMTDLPVQEFYRVYTSYCETRGITPLSKINASRILSNELSTTEPPEKPLPEPDNYDVLDDLLSDSDFTTVNPAPEQQPEYPAESSASVTKPDPEPASEEQFIPEPDTEPEVDRDPEPKEGTRAHWAWQERHRWDRKPWVKNLKDQVFNDLYNTGKELWAKYQDASDEYDWEILAFEIEECPTTRIEDEYQYYLMEVVDRFKDWIEYNGYLPKIPSHKGKAREIPEERPKTDMEREWEAANGIIDDWDEEDTEGAINDIL
ncbi:highly derived D5-like helicase-primase [Rhizophagus irregularis DAOM 181602=DAOM 197198]|nr:highly derived D5-like helicase-primase [Rhizophagus irregularis DAOM 181602=DAOM 197198]